MPAAPMRFLLPVLVLSGLLQAAWAEEEIELLDGTRLLGSIERVEAGTLVLRPLDDGASLSIPVRYLSPYSRYRAGVRSLPKEEQSAAFLLDSATWCLRHLRYDGRLKGAAEEAIRSALAKGAERASLDPVTLPFDLWWSEAGVLTDPGQGGYEKDPATGEWETKADREKRKAEEESRFKGSFLVGKPEAYRRITLDVVEASRSFFQGARIRFWAHFRLRSEDFPPRRTPDGLTLAPSKYVRLVLTDEDIASVFVPADHAGLLRKVRLLRKGERLQVFGTVRLTETGFLLVVDDLVSG